MRNPSKNTMKKLRRLYPDRYSELKKLFNQESISKDMGCKVNRALVVWHKEENILNNAGKFLCRSNIGMVRRARNMILDIAKRHNRVL